MSEKHEKHEKVKEPRKTDRLNIDKFYEWLRTRAPEGTVAEAMATIGIDPAGLPYQWRDKKWMPYGVYLALVDRWGRNEKGKLVDDVPRAEATDKNGHAYLPSSLERYLHVANVEGLPKAHQLGEVVTAQSVALAPLPKARRNGNGSNGNGHSHAAVIAPRMNEQEMHGAVRSRIRDHMRDVLQETGMNGGGDDTVPVMIAVKAPRGAVIDIRIGGQ